MKRKLKTGTILTAVFIVLVAASCKKQSVNYFQPPASTGPHKIKALDYGTGIRTSEYDTLGRLLRHNYNTGAKTEITYEGNTITTWSYNAAGSLTQKDILVLNNDGNVASATNSNNLPAVFYSSFSGRIHQQRIHGKTGYTIVSSAIKPFLERRRLFTADINFKSGLQGKF